MPPAVITPLRIAMAVVVTLIVYQAAWISDDAIITFRYVSNFVHGYGAVFNVGERVQGYTHPLWFLALAAATVVTRDEVISAIGLSFVLTFATVVVAGARLERAARDRTTGLFVTALLAVVLASSDSWRSFQTSGLEGALSTFLMVLFVVTVLEEKPSAPSPWRVLLTGSLLTTCRPDFALIVLPAGALAGWSGLRDSRERRSALLALTPLLGFVVTWIYYGDPLPNTGAAKIGIFTLGEGARQGALYFRDWLFNEPVTCVSTAALLVFGAVKLRARRERALLAGLIVYALYLVVVGGDFMRGRLLLPVFVGACTFGAAALARVLDLGWKAKTYGAAGVGLSALAFLTTKLAPEQTRAFDEGIVNERIFYVPARSFGAYLTTRRLYNDDHFETVAAYLKTCGRVTIHSRTPGWAGYYLGPELTIIDTLGLTDRFIAHLPRANLRYHPPRPGHPYKRIPVAYMAGRSDVAILDDWQEAMRRSDCSLSERALARANEPGLLP